MRKRKRIGYRHSEATIGFLVSKREPYWSLPEKVLFEKRLMKYIRGNSILDIGAGIGRTC